MSQGSYFGKRVAKCDLDERDKLYIVHLGILYRTMREVFEAPFMPYELRAALMDKAANVTREIMNYWDTTDPQAKS